MNWVVVKMGDIAIYFVHFLILCQFFSLRFVARLFFYLIGIFQLVSNSSFNLSGWPYGRW